MTSLNSEIVDTSERVMIEPDTTDVHLNFDSLVSATEVGISTPRPLRLQYNVGWSGIGIFVYAATQWLAVATLAKLTSTFTVGQFMLALAIVNPVYALTGLQLKPYLGTDVKGEHSFGEYLGTRIVLTIVGFIIIFSIAFLFVGTSSTRYAVLAVGAAKATECISDLTYGAFQRRQRMDMVACSLVLRGVFATLLLVGITWATNNLLLGIISLGLVWSAVLFFHDLPRAARFENIAPQFHIGILKIIRNTYPMAIALVISILTLTMPRYILQYYLGESAVGIFSALFYVVTANMLLAVVLGQAVSPKLAHFLNKNPKRYIHLLSVMIAVLVACGLSILTIAVYWGKQILALVYTQEYSAHNTVFVCLAVGGILLGVSSLLDYSLIITRYIRMRVLIYAIGFSTGSLAGFILIPKMQLTGAAITFLIACTAILVCQSITNLLLCYNKSNLDAKSRQT